MANRMIQVETVESVLDEAANDSNKAWTVPAGEKWELLSVRAHLVTTATMGNRTLTVDVEDASSNVVSRAQSKLVQGGAIDNIYNFARGHDDATAMVDGEMPVALGPLALGPGMTLRVWDRHAIDAAADDLSVYVLYRRTVGLTSLR